MAEIRVNLAKTIIVDDEDLPLLSKYRWYAAHIKKRAWYAQCVTSGTCILMHRLILGAKPGQLVDHIDGNGLNNRRSNIRIANNAQNQHNTTKTRGRSKFKGVSFKTRKNRWEASIRVNGKRHWLGIFKEEAAAAAAYRSAAMRLHGEFSPYRVEA